MLISRITAALEAVAPLPLQEDYDNCGLIIGDASAECKGVLLCVDVTEQRVAEAVEKGCNLIVSHLSVIFKRLKRLTGRTPAERTAIAAIKAGVAVYACHTCLDNAPEGVSAMMGEMLGLKRTKILAPQTDRSLKLTVYVPRAYAEGVRQALFDAGAGHQGRYDCCSYSSEGNGTFRALERAEPFVGNIMSIHSEPEERVELLIPSYLRSACEKAILGSHPYEQPAYEFAEVRAAVADTGCGLTGVLPEPMTPRRLADHVKAVFGSPVARCSRYPDDEMIERVALCGGSGASFLPDAIASGAQAYITSDTKYHDFADAADTIFIVDIGHYESEKCTTAIFKRVITEKFPNFAVHISQSERNPIAYL